MEGMAPEYEKALKGWDGNPPFRAYHMFDKAHVVMLTEQGIISKEDGVKILQAFRRMEAEGVETARIRVGGEDHSGEAYLITELGWMVGGRIHVGRSTGDLRTTSMHIVQRDFILDTMDALLDAQAGEIDQDARVELLEEIQDYWVSESPYVPLGQGKLVAAYQDNISGVVLDPLALFHYFLIEKN